MPFWRAVLLGIVQGLTEFLPISSTAHLLLIQQFLGRSEEDLINDPFTIVIQLGTLLAVFVYFRTDVFYLTRGFFGDLKRGHVLTSASREGRMAKLIVVGTVPVIVAGLVLNRWLKETFYNATAIGIVTLVFALLMALSEWHARRRRQKGLSERVEDDLGWLDVLWIGVFQALALMPGGSRSGTTLTAGLFVGLTRPAAARFSFLLSLPAVLAAGVKEMVDLLKAGPPAEQLTVLLVGTVTSFLVGYGAIAWLMAFLRRYPLWVFVGYRLVLGALLLALVAARMIRA